MIETALVFLFGWLMGRETPKKKAGPAPGPAPSSPSKAPWPGVERPLSPAEKKEVQRAVDPFMEKQERDASAIERAMEKEGGGISHTPKA